MNKLEKRRLKSEKKIKEIEKRLRGFPTMPDTFSYIRMYQALQELHFQGKYELTCKICNVLLNK